MKIAVNTRFLLNNKLEGIGRFTAESMQRITRNHPEHEFIFLFDRPFDPKFIFADNVKPVVLFPPARHPVLFMWWFEWSVKNALVKYKADAFLSTDGFLSLRSSVKTLLVVHDISFFHFPEQIPLLERKYYKWYMPRFIKRAKRLATVSEYSKQDLVRHFHVDPEKIDVVYNGAASEFKPLPEGEQISIRQKYTDGRPYFLYVGSLHPRKNIVRLIEAFGRFKRQSGADIKLLFAGRMAWQTGPIFEAYKKSPAQKDIQWLDYVGGKELAELTAAAFGLVYVSVLEGFGIPILEAMQCDVPVITSNISSMPEVAGEAALLADPFSIDSISSQMQKLWENEVLRKQLIEAGRLQREKFSWESTAQKLWQSIEKLNHDDY